MENLDKNELGKRRKGGITGKARERRRGEEKKRKEKGKMKG